MIKYPSKTYLPFALLGIGIICFLLSHILSITFLINGEVHKKTVFAFTVKQAVNQFNLPLGEYDHLQPASNTWLLFQPLIKIDQALTYNLVSDIQQKSISVISTERRPANLFGAIQQPLFPGDRILLNGLDVDPADRIPYQPYQSLQLIKGTTITLDMGNDNQRFSSSQPTVGLALLERDLPMQAKDFIGFPLQTNLQDVQQLGFYVAAPYTVQVDGQNIPIMAAAKTTGAGLANAGISLQGLDYSIPAADQPLPSSGDIQIIRVQEEVNIKQTKIPYETTYIGSPEVELDQREITKAGQYGVLASRERIRFENGVEISRNPEDEWTAADPINQEISYGQKVVIRTLSTPEGEIEYWRAVTVYATAYSPCRSAADRCYYGTSYGLPVQRGVIGVTIAWYSDMAGQSVYVPGYGSAVIADVGGGIAGKHWIDLGYTDEEYETMAVGAWSHDVTMYFLTPVPEGIPWILP